MILDIGSRSQGQGSRIQGVPGPGYPESRVSRVPACPGSRIQCPECPVSRVSRDQGVQGVQGPACPGSGVLGSRASEPQGV